jgi:hypothetical protein
MEYAPGWPPLASAFPWHTGHAQDTPTATQREARRRALVVVGQQAQDEVIQRAINLHQPFWLSDKFLGAMVITATGMNDDGRALTLTGVELKTSSVVVTADEVICDRTTGQIEPRGNVHIKPLPSR